MAALDLHERSRIKDWVVAGILLGMVAGIIFLGFEMVVAALMGQGFFMPLRMIGAIILGSGALEPASSLATAAIVGLLVHIALSALFGTVFAAVAAGVSAVRENRFALAGSATVYGLVLWIVNFYVIAPPLFPWFGMANEVVQFFAHAFFYGTALSLLLMAAHRGEAARQADTGPSERAARVV